MICTRVLQAAGLLLCLAAVATQSPQQAPHPPVLSTATTPNTVSAPVVDMQLLTASSGWARTATNLFFTDTAGQHWTDIGPHLAPGRRIDAVQFVGTDQAWAIAHGPNTGNSAPILMAITTDGGSSWSIAPFPADQLIGQAYGARAYMSFPDAMHGWALLSIAGSSASSRGHLFATADGGKTWSPLPYPPVYGRIQFVSESTGWLAGGVHQNFLYRTHDGGQTWLVVKLPLPEDVTPYSSLGGDENLYVTHPRVEGPYFDTPDTGAVTLLVRTTEMTWDLLTYSTADGGDTWKLTGRRNRAAGEREQNR